MKRKAASVILTLALVLSILPKGAAAVQKPTLTTDRDSIRVGQTVTATVTGSDDETITLTWTGPGISGTVTGDTFVPTVDNIGTIKVTATSNGDDSFPLSVKVKVEALEPMPEAPMISGDARVGSELSIPVQPFGITCTWYSSKDANALGTGTTYTIQESDKTYRIIAKLTGDADYGTAGVTGVSSTPTDVVKAAYLEVSLSASSVSAGTTLNASHTNTATGTITYRWTGTGVPVSQTGTDFTPGYACIGQVVTVTATSDSADDEFATGENSASATVSAITIPALTLSSDSPAVGIPLSITDGLSGITGDVNYVWTYGDGVRTLGSEATYTPAEADAGKTIMVTVTGKDETNYKGSTQSKTTARAVPLITYTVSLSDTTPEVGDVLTIDTAPVGAEATIGANISWQNANNSAVLGTGASYTVQAADIGVQIKAVATASGIYSTTAVSSEASTAVSRRTYTISLPANPKVDDVLSITGVPEGVSATYKWTQDGESATLGADATYTVAATDSGKRIKVEVTLGGETYIGTAVTATTTNEVSYILIAGGGAVTKGNPLSFTFNTAESPAAIVALNVGDDVLTLNEDYTVTAGSTVITLKAEFLNTLTAARQYTLTGTFGDPAVAFEPQLFTVNNVPAPTSAPGRANPSTGA